MPWGLIGSALIGGVSSLLGSRSARKNSNAQTQQARNWELEDRPYFENQYQTRRQHALEDNASGLHQDNQGLSNRISMLGEKHGLTPQEVMGSPAAGGFSSSGATLGQSGAAAHGAKVQAETSAKDRTAMLQAEGIRAETAMNVAAINNATALGQSVIGAKSQKYNTDTQADTQRRGQDVQTQVANIAAEAGKYNSRQIAAATKYAADASERASKYASDNNLAASYNSARSQRMTALDQLAQKKLVDKAQIDSISAQTGLLLQDQRFKAEVHSERWAKLFSTMGAENVAASALAVINGVDIESVLKGVQADEATKLNLRRFITQSTAKDSYIAKELTGGGQVVRGIAKGTWDTLTSPFRGE